MIRIDAALDLYRPGGIFSYASYATFLVVKCYPSRHGVLKISRLTTNKLIVTINSSYLQKYSKIAFQNKLKLINLYDLFFNCTPRFPF